VINGEIPHPRWWIWAAGVTADRRTGEGDEWWMKQSWERVVAGYQIPAYQHARSSLSCLSAMAAQLGTTVEHAAAANLHPAQREKSEGETPVLSN